LAWNATRRRAEQAIGPIIQWYNRERLHGSLGCPCPIDYHRGNPQKLHEREDN
jgi:hypothetical protein